MRLRLLTYNIHKGVGTDGVLDLARIADVVRHYDADVVALQEVTWYEPWRGRVSQAVELAGALLPPYAAVGLNCRRHFGIYGNATFSRHPIVSHANVDLTVPMKRARAALHTCVAADGAAPLHVFNVHLGLARYERRLQVERLADEIDEVAPAPSPVVVLGDTNDWRDRLFPGVLAARGFRRATAPRRGPAPGTFPSWYPVGDIDRVFVRGALSLVRSFPSRLALARVASDHLPVVTDVELAAEDAP